MTPLLRQSICILGAAVMLACITPASLGAAPADPGPEDLERAFQAVLADPTDMDAAFEYARIAAALGDFEAAVSSLERMLMFNPDLLQVKVELGVLYFRLGSFGAAQTYLDQALAHEDLPPEVRERIDTFMAEIERQVSPHRLAFSLSAGIRYQSNANLAPGNTILSGGSPTALPIEFAAEDDFAVFGDFQVRHRYDFGNADGDHLDTNLRAYTSQQFTVDEFDLIFLDADTGPRLYLPGADGVSVRPYVRGSTLFLEGRYYQGVFGGGAELNVPIAPDWTASLDGRWQYASYVGSADRPSAEELNGQEVRLEAEIAYQFGGGGISLSGEAASIGADADFEVYQEFSVRLFAWKDIPAPVDISSARQPWIVTFSAEALTRNYDEANPAVSANVRNDTEYRLDSQLVVPVSAAASVFVGAGWQDVRSNLPNYTFDNFTALSGINVRF